MVSCAAEVTAEAVAAS